MCMCLTHTHTHTHITHTHITHSDKAACTCMCDYKSYLRYATYGKCFACQSIIITSYRIIIIK